MISALIPIYNFDVSDFVKELHTQFEIDGDAYEILLADDASADHFRIINSKLSTLTNVKYIQLDQNIGRSRIRNFLADRAKYDYLLFMDCDSEIPSRTFIKLYKENIKIETVVCGGRSYRKERPEKKEMYFRWLYGVNRESAGAITRNKYPCQSFMTNNYLIPKEVHQAIRFDENIIEYGHEDTLFGIELKRRGYIVVHINNPLVHIGLEPAEEFLSKTTKAIENLVYLKENYRYSELNQDIKLLRVYYKYPILRNIYRFIGLLFFRSINRQLTGRHPSLFLFDINKITYLARYYHRYQRPKVS
jgi:glycosyltransferase involved in cell wall biosynthesis